MKKLYKLWGIIFLAICLFTACTKPPSVDDSLGSGADKFAEGKTEEGYALLSYEDVLDRLLDEYSGSRSEPTGEEITKDEGDDIIDSVDDEQVIGKEDKVTVESKADLKKLMHQMFDETKNVASFTMSDQYTINLDVIKEICLELEREDAFDVICLDTYSLAAGDKEGTIYFTYTMSESELKKMKQETRILLAAAEKEIDVTGQSDYEKVCTVNEYLCDLIVYPDKEPYAPETHTAYSAFKNGSAVCDGYSRAAKLLLNDYGIECDLVVGECPNRGGHAWNLVQLDEKWYQLDVTWNDGAAEYDKEGRSQYLLVTDDFMKQSRIWDYSLYPATPDKSYR